MWLCTCRDPKRRRDWCKHALAVALLCSCVEYRACPPLDPDQPIPYVLTPLGEAAAQVAAPPAHVHYCASCAHGKGESFAAWECSDAACGLDAEAWWPRCYYERHEAEV